MQIFLLFFTGGDKENYSVGSRFVRCTVWLRFMSNKICFVFPHDCLHTMPQGLVFGPLTFNHLQ